MKPTNTQQNIEARSGNLAGMLKSSSIAAVIAFVIYVVIAAVTGGSLSREGFVVGLEIALATLTLTFIITFIVGSVMRRRKG